MLRIAAITAVVRKMSILLSPAQNSSVDAMNALLVIAPYKYQGMWVFDDPAVGLSREPFIAGIDTMIDKAVADIPNAEKGFRAKRTGSWSGDEKNRAAIGTTATSSRWKAGSVPRS